MAVDQSFAPDDFGDCFQFEIAPDGRAAVALLFCQGFGVLPGGGEAVGVEGGDAHAGLGEAIAEAVAPVGLLDIFAEGEFDAAGGSGEFERFWSGSLAQLDDAVLTSDGIGRAVEEIGYGQPAGQLLMDGFGF